PLCPSVSSSLSFSFYSYAAHRDLHSFPTRRSSDLHEVLRVRGAHAFVDVESVRLTPDSDYLRPELPEDMRCDVICRAMRRVNDEDRKSTRLNSSHVKISYAVFCLKKKKKNTIRKEN